MQYLYEELMLELNSLLNAMSMPNVDVDMSFQFRHDNSIYASSFVNRLAIDFQDLIVSKTTKALHPKLKMSIKNILSNPALKSRKHMELNEEWNNFMKRIGEVSGLVKDLASGDKEKADAAQILADQYLAGKNITGGDEEVKVKENRTVINKRAFQTGDKKDNGEIDKDAWMAEVERDAEQRALDRKIRREKADTLNTQAIKAFRRGEYEKALSCYDRAIEHVKDNAMFYCDRALTNIKLGNYDKVFKDCDWALKLNENSFKARLYKAKAYKMLRDDKYAESKKELDEMFPQHEELIEYFLGKKEEFDEDEVDDGTTTQNILH